MTTRRVFTLTVELEGAAFHSDAGDDAWWPSYELGRILSDAAEHLEQGGAVSVGDFDLLRDVNGNTVGRWEIKAKRVR